METTSNKSHKGNKGNVSATVKAEPKVVQNNGELVPMSAPAPVAPKPIAPPADAPVAGLGTLPTGVPAPVAPRKGRSHPYVKNADGSYEYPAGGWEALRAAGTPIPWISPAGKAGWTEEQRAEHGRAFRAMRAAQGTLGTARVGGTSSGPSVPRAPRAGMTAEGGTRMCESSLDIVARTFWALSMAPLGSEAQEVTRARVMAGLVMAVEGLDTGKAGLAELAKGGFNVAAPVPSATYTPAVGDVVRVADVYVKAYTGFVEETAELLGDWKIVKLNPEQKTVLLKNAEGSKMGVKSAHVALVKAAEPAPVAAA